MHGVSGRLVASGLFVLTSVFEMLNPAMLAILVMAA